MSWLVVDERDGAILEWCATREQARAVRRTVMAPDHPDSELIVVEQVLRPALEQSLRELRSQEDA